MGGEGKGKGGSGPGEGGGFERAPRPMCKCRYVDVHTASPVPLKGRVSPQTRGIKGVGRPVLNFFPSGGGPPPPSH